MCICLPHITVFLLYESGYYYWIWSQGFKEEIGGRIGSTNYPEFGVVQDADRLDAIGAIGNSYC